MHRHLTVITALAVLLTGCSSGTTTPQPQASLPATTASAPGPVTSPTPSGPAPGSAKPPAPAKVSRNVRDCYDGECILLLTKPITIPLDAKKLHYPGMRVTAYSKKDLTYTVIYPPGSGGGSETTFPIDGSGGFGYRDSPRCRSQAEAHRRQTRTGPAPRHRGVNTPMNHVGDDQHGFRH